MKKAHILLAILLLAPLVALHAADNKAGTTKASISKTNLFEARTGGYHTYRVPGIVATKAGTLLACRGPQDRHGRLGRH